jgi:hypothetical protein
VEPFWFCDEGESENERAPGNSQSGKRYTAHGHDHDFYWDIFAGAES